MNDGATGWIAKALRDIACLQAFDLFNFCGVGPYLEMIILRGYFFLSYAVKHRTGSIVFRHSLVPYGVKTPYGFSEPSV